MNILYCRKSTESEDRQVLSIESQTNELKGIALKRGLKFDQIFTESKSAHKPGRVIFDKIIKLIEKNPSSNLFCWKLDRLARNAIDGGRIIWLLQQGKIKEIITPYQTFLPTDNVLSMYVEFGMSDQYSKDLSLNVKRGNKTKLEKGGYTSLAPFGYLNNKETKTVVVDSLRAPFVEKIFRTFATGGYSLKDLSNKLYAEGLRTKTGRKIHASLLYRMITNPFYLGIVVIKGQHYRGNHTSLVSQELWDSCQSIFSGNRSKRQKHLFPLRGYVSCPLCGCMITASTRKGHTYYHCTDGKHKHTQGREHFKAEILNTAVATKFQELQFTEEQIEIMYQASLEENKQDGEMFESAKANILASQKLLTARRARLEDTYLDGSMTKERYEARILDLNNDEVGLSNQLSELEKKSGLHGNATIGQTKKAFLTGLYAQKNYLNGDDLKKRELVEILLSDVTVNEQKIQSIRFKPAYQRMFETPKNIAFSNWGA
jgi:DNA invertase Pin-like site-specific DNA recombinase